MARNLVSFSLVLALCLFTPLTYGANKCNKRTFNNHNSFVCVCNEDFCDTVDPIQRQASGVIQIWETTRAEKRFDLRAQIFNDESYVPPPAYEYKLSVDRSESYQEIFGFGGAFSDATSLGVGSMSTKIQEDILQAYFGQNGLEYSLARVVIAGSDFSNRGYTYNEVENDWDQVNWALVDEDISYKIPQILRAKSISKHDMKLFASSWSPPAWLKNNGQLNHGGSLSDSAGSRIWETYAGYLVKFFQAYKARGIDFWGMTVQNEVAVSDPWFPWNTCFFSAEMERDFVKMDLGPQLERAGWTPDDFTIMVLDHNRNLLPGHAQTILNDAQASRFVKGTAVHWYGNDGKPATVYDELHNMFPNKFILATEACEFFSEQDKIGLGDFGIGEKYAHDIIRDLTHWVVGWTDWNMVLDMQGGPNWANNGQSAPIHVNPQAGEFYKNPSFYAMGHFSKFLPPGSKRIRTNPEIIDNDRFQTGAFLRPDGGIVVIAINSWDDNELLILNDSQLGQVKLSIEPHSFNTYLYY